ncbi:MAG: CHASE2 domain-containing protein, partial [Bdellovibrionales bacterium]|nr:CHASE2 domain-containing protein [Bdellovibrionales bacterium]
MSTRWIIVGLLSLLTTIIHGVLFSTFAGDTVEPFALDLWFNIREKISAPEVPKDVVLIGMDEQSYSILDIPMTEIWPRDVHAKLVEKLAAAGAKRVVFDILFLDRSTDQAADQKFAQALKKMESVLGSEIYVRQESTLGGTFVLEEYQEPYDKFVESSTAALVGLPAEQGRIRRFYTARPRQFEEIPTLAEAAAGITQQNQPGLPSKRDFINYYGPPGRIATFYYSRVLEDEHPLPMEEIFKDKIVIVGLVLRTEIGPAQKDVFLSPFVGRRIYGSEVHATLTANLLQKDWITRGSFMGEFASLSICCFIIAMII